jgi:N6-L-threonylcarbamoyladenine synthase
LDSEPVEFPALGLVVSGGHTEIHRIRNWGHYELLGATRDDAAGEAFDKVAKLLGLEYPGGPAIEKLAQEIQGDPGLFSLTKMKDKSRDFSFSGLKTAVAIEVKKRRNLLQVEKVRLAARFQNTVITEILVRLRPLLVKEGPKSLVVGGGVACNGVLREALQAVCRELGVKLRIPPPSFCGDNAAMVAGLGAQQIGRGIVAEWSANASASPSYGTPFLIK